MVTKKKTSYALDLQKYTRWGEPISQRAWSYRFQYDDANDFFDALCYDKLSEYFALRTSDTRIVVRMHNYKVPDSHRLRNLRDGFVNIDGKWVEDIYTRFKWMISENENDDGYCWMTVEVRS